MGEGVLKTKAVGGSTGIPRLSKGQVFDEEQHTQNRVFMKIGVFDFKTQ